MTQPRMDISPLQRAVEAQQRQLKATKELAERIRKDREREAAEREGAASE